MGACGVGGSGCGTTAGAGLGEIPAASAGMTELFARGWRSCLRGYDGVVCAGVTELFVWRRQSWSKCEQALSQFAIRPRFLFSRRSPLKVSVLDLIRLHGPHSSRRFEMWFTPPSERGVLWSSSR